MLHARQNVELSARHAEIKELTSNGSVKVRWPRQRKEKLVCSARRYIVGFSCQNRLSDKQEPLDKQRRRIPIRSDIQESYDLNSHKSDFAQIREYASLS